MNELPFRTDPPPPPRALIYALEALVDDYGTETVRAALDEVRRWNDPAQDPTWAAP